MRNNTPRTYTDEDILSMHHVTADVAAHYLKMPTTMLRGLIEKGQLPFGTCRNEHGKRTFYINAQILVDYKNGRSTDGAMYKALFQKVDELNRHVADLTQMVAALTKAG